MHLGSEGWLGAQRREESKGESNHSATANKVGARSSVRLRQASAGRTHGTRDRPGRAARARKLLPAPDRRKQGHGVPLIGRMPGRRRHPPTARQPFAFWRVKGLETTGPRQRVPYALVVSVNARLRSKSVQGSEKRDSRIETFVGAPDMLQEMPNAGSLEAKSVAKDTTLLW